MFVRMYKADAEEKKDNGAGSSNDIKAFILH